VIDQADEVEVVDMSPHALRQRIRHGNVYPRERAEQALRSFFREGNLNALRELALRKVATTVEQDLEEYMREQHIDEVWAASERVLVCVGANAEAQYVLRRGAQLAARLQADLLAVFVETPGWSRTDSDGRRQVEENLRYAEDLGAEVLRVSGSDLVSEVGRVAREKNAGSIVVGYERKGGPARLLRPTNTDRLLRLADEIDVYVVADR
jgi:two-component system sensor histidine kinase KdpD